MVAPLFTKRAVVGELRRTSAATTYVCNRTPHLRAEFSYSPRRVVRIALCYRNPIWKFHYACFAVSAILILLLLS